MASYVKRTRCDDLSLRAYNMLIGVILLYGFVMNYFMCVWFTNVFAEWNITLVLIGYFVVAITGILMSQISDNPAISFLGYNLVVLPVGVILSLALKEYETQAIINAIIVTAGVTFLMLFLSTIKPDIFLSMGKALFVALTCGIVVELLCLIFGFIMPGIWDALFAILFALYIGYDWAKAQQEDYTVDNAVDACVGLYLDVINLLLRVLGSSSKSKKN